MAVYCVLCKLKFHCSVNMNGFGQLCSIPLVHLSSNSLEGCSAAAGDNLEPSFHELEHEAHGREESEALIGSRVD